jgi:methylated-DNA-[protein]-cysteine S-methyltransferase
MTLIQTNYLSPLGMLALGAQEDALLTCQFVTRDDFGTATTAFLAECIAQLDAYFRGELQQFSLNLQPSGGSPFMQRVWQHLGEIPYGKTSSYGAVAATLGQPKAARAVGMANRHNPIAIIIPCHRVIAKQGHINGYAYGVWRKSWLLAHEARTLQRLNTTTMPAMNSENL